MTLQTKTSYLENLVRKLSQQADDMLSLKIRAHYFSYDTS